MIMGRPLPIAALLTFISWCAAEDGIFPQINEVAGSQTRRLAQAVPQGTQTKFAWLPVAKNKQGKWDCPATCKAKGLQAIDEVVDKPFDINRGVPQGSLCVMETRSYGPWYGMKTSTPNACSGPFKQYLTEPLPPTDPDVWMSWSLPSGYKCACYVGKALAWLSTSTNNHCLFLGKDWIPEKACRYAEPGPPGVPPKLYYGTVAYYQPVNQRRCIYYKAGQDIQYYSTAPYEYLCVKNA